MIIDLCPNFIAGFANELLLKERFLMILSTTYRLPLIGMIMCNLDLAWTSNNNINSHFVML